MKLIAHIISTTNKDNYTIRQIGVPMTGANALAERPWTYRQIKINLDPDISLHVFKWKLIWDSDLPTSNQEGEEIPYVVRKMTSREGITPMPTGLAVMLWLEQISNSLEASPASANKSLRDLGLRQGNHVIIAPCMVIGNTD